MLFDLALGRMDFEMAACALHVRWDIILSMVLLFSKEDFEWRVA